MNKDIKDYLHLYLGCEMFIFPASTVLDGWLSNAVNRHEGLQWHYTLTVDNIKKTINDGYLPILRPLSDMTEEDHAERMKLKTNPEEIRYLLSKGFDLFDLIPAGLAIDKTKLNKEQTP